MLNKDQEVTKKKNKKKKLRNKVQLTDIYSVFLKFTANIKQASRISFILA